jgi:hypothetical protein
VDEVQLGAMLTRSSAMFLVKRAPEFFIAFAPPDVCDRLFSDIPEGQTLREFSIYCLALLR